MLSIITPTHRRGRFWDLTVESVMDQTCLDFEWVVLDNSPDFYFRKEFDIFKSLHPEYEEAYKRVRIFEEHASEMKPVGYWKNRAVELTTCEYNDFVLVFDHDDFMCKTTVQDILGCAHQYGERIHYICGDCILLLPYNDGFLPKSIYNGNSISKAGQDITIGEHFSLRTSSVIVGQMKDFNMKGSAYNIHSHPRAIKRYLLDTIPFRFYEGVRTAEDLLQHHLAPIFLNVGWIDRYTVVYVLHNYGTEDTNTIRTSSEDELRKIMSIENDENTVYQCMKRILGDNTNKEFYHFNNF